MADHSAGPGRLALSRGKLRHGFTPLFWLSQMAALVQSQGDIRGASLAGREPPALKCKELRFWLKCRGLKTDAALLMR